ncbi:MAG: hypothetical protein LBI64_05125 [Coriobacteriales bacterium]|jgi:hypothetical protein|nr:hypothetical protein [Coriobacteriales bacterium]
MFQNDYLMRMILQMVQVMQRAMTQMKEDPEQTAAELERVIGEAVDIEGDLFFSLAPESMVSMLQIGNFDEQLGGYVIRSIYYEAELLEKAGHTQRADLRRAQADAVAKAYGYDITPADLQPEALSAYFSDEEDPEEGSDEDQAI